MISVEVKSASIVSVLKQWERFQPSEIAHHQRKCCQVAQSWFTAMDQALRLGHDSFVPPMWIRDRYSWGPSKWPLHWCQSAQLSSLDCGAFATLTRGILTARGVVAFPVQLIQQFSPQATHHWRKLWESSNSSSNWVENDLVYHEAVAIVIAPGIIKVWDPTDNAWIDPEQYPGYASTLAIRISTEGLSRLREEEFHWGNQPINTNCWYEISPCDSPPDFI